jgi:hypothetical protein
MTAKYLPFYDGFEAGDFSKWTTQQTPTVYHHSEQPSYFAVHSGEYGALAIGSNTYWYTDVCNPSPPINPSELYLSGYIQIFNSLPSSSRTYFLTIREKTNGHFVSAGLRTNSSGAAYWVLNGDNAQIREDQQATIVPVSGNSGIWYFIEIAYRTNGTAELWVNNQSIYQTSGLTLPNNQLEIRAGNVTSDTPSGFAVFGDEYSASTSFIDQHGVKTSVVQADNLLRLITPDGANYVDLQAEYVYGMGDPATVLKIAQFTQFGKDVNTDIGFLGTTSHLKGVGGGAVSIGHGYQNVDFPPCIALCDSGDDSRWGVLHIYANPAAGTLGNMKLDTLFASSVKIASTHNLFAVTAGDNGLNQDTYIIPQNPSSGGLGLGTGTIPFKWIDATTVFTTAITTLTSGATLTIYPNTDFSGSVRMLGSLIIPYCTVDPSSPGIGQIWLRTDL